MKSRTWNPYAEAYDLALDSMVELEEADEARRALDELIAKLPSWVVEELKLEEASELLANAVLAEGVEA